jgi:hypothetical protein
MVTHSLEKFVVLTSMALLFACGTSTSEPGASSDAGPSGTSTCDPVAFATLNAAGSNAKVCAATIRCIGDKCLSAARECAGPDYASGVYAGTCATYYGCVKTCKCVKSCVDQCTPDSIGCSECLSYKLGYGCTVPCATEIASCGT